MLFATDLQKMRKHIVLIQKHYLSSSSISVEIDKRFDT